MSISDVVLWYDSALVHGHGNTTAEEHSSGIRLTDNDDLVQHSRFPLRIATA